MKAQLAALKEQMGYPIEANLELDYDRKHMENESLFDTSQSIVYDKRIEFQLLQTQKRLQEDDLNYYEWSFIPSVSAYGGYTLNYQNSFVAPLYNQKLSELIRWSPAFVSHISGGKRIQEIKQAKLQLDRFDYGFLLLKNSINTQYSFALANL